MVFYRRPKGSRGSKGEPPPLPAERRDLLEDLGWWRFSVVVVGDGGASTDGAASIVGGASAAAAEEGGKGRRRGAAVPAAAGDGAASAEGGATTLMAGSGISSPRTTALDSARRFAPPREFCVYRALNLTTLFMALKVLTSISCGVSETMNVTPSEQGGVVREPVYLWKDVFWTAADMEVRSSVAPSISMLSPAVGIWFTEFKTVEKAFVAAGPEDNWKSMPTTAIWLGSAMKSKALGRMGHERAVCGLHLLDDSCTMCTSTGKYSPLIWCSLGV